MTVINDACFKRMRLKQASFFAPYRHVTTADGAPIKMASRNIHDTKFEQMLQIFSYYSGDGARGINAGANPISP